jgi:hypothetical protein
MTGIAQRRVVTGIAWRCEMTDIAAVGNNSILLGGLFDSVSFG